MDNTQFYRRIFLGIPVPEAIRGLTAGIYHQLHHEVGYNACQWVKPALQHITIQYLGGVSGGSLIALSEELRPVMAQIPKFTLEVGPLRLFPNLRKAHCLILRVSTPPALQAAVQHVQRCVGGMNIDADTKPFRPHVILARIPAKIRRLNRPELVLPEFSWDIDRISLLDSQPDGSSIQYETITQFALNPTAQAHDFSVVYEEEEAFDLA